MNVPVTHVDGSGFSEDMPRMFGCAPKGARCFGSRGWQAKRRTNAVGAAAGAGLLAAALFDSSTDTDVLEAWIRQELLPVLPNGNAVVMDNASFHESEKIQELVEAAGCLLEFLPPHSPDLDPVEHE